MRETVSVVIPARDAAATLARCLDALAAQTRAPDEIVVVDNDSRDATAEVATTFGSRHPSLRLRVVSTPGHRGPGPVRNAGARAATGGVLAFTDADCIPPPSWLAELVAPLERDADAVASAGTVAIENDRGLAATLQDLLHLPHDQAGEIRVFGGWTDAVVTNSLAVRANAFALAGGFDERLRWLEDTAFPAALLARAGGKIVRTPGASVAHHVPTTIGGCLGRAWKYGLAAASLFHVLWERKLLVEVTRRLRVETSALPGRIWILATPDKVVAGCASAGLLWAPAVLLALLPLGYYALDLRRRAVLRGRRLGVVETVALLVLDLAYHAVLTAGRICGSPRGRSACV